MAHSIIDGDRRPSTSLLVLAALGVVFGDIGTSPLYALKECFDNQHNAHAIAATREHVLGVLSLVFWALLVIVTVKYFFFVLRASRNGEGGVLALASLAVEKFTVGSRSRWLLMLGAIFGASLLFGDGMITPSISVLSAVEGLENAVGLPHGLVLVVAAAVLVGLFTFQRFGTEKVGRVFGPLTLTWFVVMAVLGVSGIVRTPEVLQAVNPVHGVQFLFHGGSRAFFVLGSVFLAVTGAESLYADMGHFGRRPMALGWFWLVWPSLLCSYFGQGALLLAQPELTHAEDFHPFFMLAPSWALLPLVVLATLAACIASQALITGVFSLTLQTIQLGYLPRMSIKHTSAHTRGQIYVPTINWLLMVACLLLVLGFGSSSRLASAYGVAVSLTMVVTTALLFFAARSQWGWGNVKALALCVPLLVIELTFASVNLTKIPDGGWFPLATGAVLFAVMTTWRRGRELILREQEASALSQEDFLASLQQGRGPLRVPGTAIFMGGNRGRTPIAMLHNLKHNKVLHERVIFLTIVTDNMPFVPREKQAQLEVLGEGVFRLTGHYGYMQEPDVPQLLRRAETTHGLRCSPEEATFFLGRETIVPAQQRGMAKWREHLFAFLVKLAQPPSSYFKLPENRVVELGMRVRI